MSFFAPTPSVIPLTLPYLPFCPTLPPLPACPSSPSLSFPGEGDDEQALLASKTDEFCGASKLSLPLALRPPLTSQVREMASKHHPHLVRLLGYCIDFNPSTRHIEQILVYDFGVVMLVVITARKAVHMADDIQINLKQWVAPLVESGDVASFKDPLLDAPDDLLLRLARLALTCTAMPTASRPTMGRVLGDLLGMKEEVIGSAEAHRAASRIDREIGSSAAHTVDFDAQLAGIEQMGAQSHLSGDA
ncbi:unnamed protein product [Closterium sp. NIES-64]|nr:unnamed protein product [Closterium sp. NIES-64]